MKIYNISSDSEQTLSDRVEGVDYDLLQADADSKADCQQQETVPGIETRSENEIVQDDPPLDITPISVCFPRYTTSDRILKISDKLQSMLSTVRIVTPSEKGNVQANAPLDDSTTGRIYKLQCVIRGMVDHYTALVKEKCDAAKKKNNLQMNVSLEAPSDHPGPSEVKAPSPEPNAVPCDQPLSDNKVAVKKKRNPCFRYKGMKVDFEIPSHVDTSDMDLDNLVPSFEARPNQDPRRTREFSFVERLRQWEFEVRERDFGKYDMYYYYGTLGYFRSIPEVTRFIMYEEYPGGKPLPGRNRRKSPYACQSEVLPLEPGSSSMPFEAKRMRRTSKPNGDNDKPEAEVDGILKKPGKKRGRKPKGQSQVLSVEQESTSKTAEKRGRKRKYDQPDGNNEATMSNIEMMLNNETSVIRETSSNPEGHVAVMLDETMIGLRCVTGFTTELGNTSQGDEAAAPSDGNP